MKYLIEGDYDNGSMEGKLHIDETDSTDIKDFIIYGMPSLIQDLFEKFGEALKEKAKGVDMSYDKIIGVMSLMSVICQNTLSDKLTESLNEFLADDPEQVEEDSEGINLNRWDVLLGNNQNNKC